MNIVTFTKEFPDEEACKKKWKALREQEGIVCPKCGCTEHYWKKDKECFECKHCGHRQSLRAGTIMHGSQLPFRYWFIAMHLLTSTKKSFSALEMQRQLGHKYYHPIWAMMQKLRYAMGKRDEKYKLCGDMEMDEGFFTIDMPEDDKGNRLKRGRGSQKKCAVLVMAESEPVDFETMVSTRHKINKRVRNIKMRVLENLKAETIDTEVRKGVSEDSSLTTDDSTSYVNLKDNVSNHKPQVIPKEDIGKVLPWVHIVVSNAKRLILNIYHDIKRKYLQEYLNEFCYKFNRRFLGNEIFDRLLVACVTVKNGFRY